ncbi:MAG: class I SAM-dependent methyltransferase [Bacteroidales bacterium]|jgi:SAM-dependent methyltransferase
MESQDKIKMLLERIDHQLMFNQGKNIFHNSGTNALSFISETKQSAYVLSELDTETKSLLVDYITDKVIEEFCRINQYYSFDQQSKQELRHLYTELMSAMEKMELPLKTISENHFGKIISWLQKHNAFAEQIYSTKTDNIEPVTCAEYSAELQLKILHINPNEINTPVLDIGCGKLGNMVRYLRNNGLETFGFDRFATEGPFIDKHDWLEYSYGDAKWGTIISNLGFTNHFYHHHLRDDGRFIEYAKKYIEILTALKPGGQFFYAPGLDFIEQYLDKKRFSVTPNPIESTGIKSVTIKKLA